MCDRGGENIVDMTKKAFQLCYDNETKMSFVKKVEDEMSKNHHENDQQEIITGFIPQLLQSNGTPHKLCPVRSFENYVRNLNEHNNKLWQHPWISN